PDAPPLGRPGTRPPPQAPPRPRPPIHPHKRHRGRWSRRFGAAHHRPGRALMQIRPPAGADAAAAADVYIGARHHAAAAGTIPPMEHADDDVRRYFAEVLIPHRETFVAIAEDEVAGVLVLDGDEVDQLYVAPG